MKIYFCKERRVKKRKKRRKGKKKFVEERVKGQKKLSPIPKY